MKKIIQTIAFAIFTLLTLTGMAFAGALSDTGQTRCYNDTAEITCPAPGEDFYGQDAQYIINPRSIPNWMPAETTSPIPQPRGQWCGTM